MHIEECNFILNVFNIIKESFLFLRVQCLVILLVIHFFSFVIVTYFIYCFNYFFFSLFYTFYLSFRTYSFIWIIYFMYSYTWQNSCIFFGNLFLNKKRTKFKLSLICMDRVSFFFFFILNVMWCLYVYQCKQNEFCFIHIHISSSVYLCISYRCTQIFF